MTLVAFAKAPEAGGGPLPACSKLSVPSTFPVSPVTADLGAPPTHTHREL